MTQAFDLVVIGSTNVDLFLQVDHLPRPGETLLGRSSSLEFGGKGGNQAVMAARLGANVGLFSCVGGDHFGQFALRHYSEQNISIQFMQQDTQRATGLACICVDNQGANCIVVAPGANQALSVDHIHDHAHMIAKARLVLAQLEVPMACIVEGFRIARQAGALTMLNAAPMQPLSPELLTLTDICVLNEPEIEQLTGQPLVDRQQVQALARVVRKLGPRMVLVTLGAHGAWIESDEMSEAVPAPCVEVVDTTGAGDVFVATLAVGLIQGIQPVVAAGWANHAAALAVTRRGTQSAFPSQADIEAFMKVKWPTG